MKPTDTNVEEVHSELAQPEAPRNGHKTVQIDRLTGGSQADPVSEPAASPAAESSTTCVVCNDASNPFKAHKCPTCKKPCHVLCGRAITDDEVSMAGFWSLQLAELLARRYIHFVMDVKKIDKYFPKQALCDLMRLAPKQH